MKSISVRQYDTQLGSEIATWPQTAHEARLWAGPENPFPMTEKQLAQRPNDPDVNPFVGWLDRNLVAYGELWIDTDEQEIELARILVNPVFRKKGIGQLFVRHLIKQAEATQPWPIFLRVDPQNKAAITCYTKAGFKEVPDEEQLRYNKSQPVNYRWFTYKR